MKMVVMVVMITMTRMVNVKRTKEPGFVAKMVREVRDEAKRGGRTLPDARIKLYIVYKLKFIRACGNILCLSILNK